MKKHLLSFLFLFILNVTIGQQLFYSNIFRGGVITRLFSYMDSSFATIKIPPNSTIKKCYLIVGNQVDSKYPTAISINGNNILLTQQDQVSNRFQSTYLKSGSVYIRDVTNFITQNTDTINLNVSAINFPPDEINQYFRLITYTIYISYTNDYLPPISSNIFINNKTIEAIVNYNYNSLPPINTGKPVGLSCQIGHTTNFLWDASSIYLNNNYIGSIYGFDEANQQVFDFEVLGQFDYYNDTLFGYGDDTPDSLMSQADALADISSYLSNGTTSFNVRLEYQTLGNPINESSNPVWATFLTYTTPCDTFSTSINIPDTTICYGESVNLVASGGATYQWEVFGNAVGYADTLAIQPDSSLYYIVKITDTNGCMKTEMAHIVVNPPVQIGNVVVSPTLCGAATGNIAVENVSGGTVISGGAYIYSINGVQNPTVSIYYNEFTNLQEGTYNIQVTDFYGCTANDTVTVGSYINTVAQFSASPQSGEAPLNVVFSNQSSNAINYTWYINNEESPAFAGENYTFDSVGVYTVTLYAYGNDTTCVDSASVLVNVVSPFRVFIPTFYDAGLGSLYLDTRGCKTVTLEIFDEIGKLIYVEKKTVTDGQNEFWKGYNARGIYLYRIFAEGIDGTKLEQSGKLVLMR